MNRNGGYKLTIPHTDHTPISISTSISNQHQHDQDITVPSLPPSDLPHAILLVALEGVVHSRPAEGGQQGQQCQGQHHEVEKRQHEDALQGYTHTHTPPQ